MRYRFATPDDAAVLSEMNSQLIRDEGHRNRMSAPELEHRLRGWLSGEYAAVLFENAGQPFGYALFRQEPEYVYLRQFFVRPENRRNGIGREAMNWLSQHAWNGQRVRIDVLVGNTVGAAFWRAIGFVDYCLTMEWDAGDA